VPSVDDVEGLTNVNLGLAFSWLDPRLAFLNLAANKELNVLAAEEAAAIWVPAIHYDNKVFIFDNSTLRMHFSVFKTNQER
jgi:hypothetical protein